MLKKKLETLENLVDKDQLKAKRDADKLTRLLSSNDQASRIERGRNVFNFTSDEVITVEKVIQATYSNPNRQKFLFISQYEERFPLHQANLSEQELISIIKSTIPSAVS